MNKFKNKIKCQKKKEKEMATHSSILDEKNLMDSGTWWAAVHGVAKSQAPLSD